jgi:hypothetical protein
MLNCQLRLITAALHDPDVEADTLADDSRITYLPQDDDFFQRWAQGPTVTQTAGTVSPLTLFSSGIFQASTRLLATWALHVTSSSTADLVFTDSGGAYRLEAVAFTTEDGLSSPVALPDSPFSVRFAPETGRSWTVQALARPHLSLMSLLTGLHAFAPELFGTDPAYAGWRFLWESSPWPATRLAAFALALAKRTDALRGTV